MVKRAKAAMPGFIKPQLATLKMKAPSEGWIHEIKYDGYRVQVHVDKGAPPEYSPATATTGPSGSQPSPALSSSKVRPSSMGKWSSSTKAGPIS
jgi:hypothetical protein